MAQAIDRQDGDGASVAVDDKERIGLSVVLPAYNEATNLRQLIPEIVETLEWLDRGEAEIVIVDDGSTDETAAAARQAASLYECVRFVRLQANFGQSEALAAGIDHARGDVVVTMDADQQNDPADIPRLLDRLDRGADCVSGWRRDRQDPLAKRIPSRIQTRLAMWTGPDIHDFGCTLTAYRSEALAECDLRGERHRYIPAQLHELGYDVAEIEVEHHAREHGSSHYGAGRLVRGFVDLVYHLFRVRYRTRPMHIFGAVGLSLFGLGVGLGGWLVALKYLAGLELSTRLPKLLLSISLALFGFGVFALGLITELLSELIWQSEDPYRVAEVVE
jgi:glycosyltransferase involved in cell wall biosynthesis